MEEIYKNVLLSVHSLTQLSGATYKFYGDPTDENGDKLVKMVDECEKKFLKVKEEIVKMIREIENRQEVEKVEEIKEIEAIQTKRGFLIKE